MSGPPKKTSMPLLRTQFALDAEQDSKTLISPIEEHEEVSPVVTKVNPFGDRQGTTSSLSQHRPQHGHSSSLPGNVLLGSFSEGHNHNHDGSRTHQNNGLVVDNLISVPNITMDSTTPVTPKNDPLHGRRARAVPDYANDSDFEYSGDFSFGAGSSASTSAVQERDPHSHGGHSRETHFHSHDPHSHEDHHGLHPHDDHSHNDHSHAEHPEPYSSERPLNNFISYFFPFLSDSSDDIHRSKAAFTPSTSSAIAFVKQLYESKETKSIFRFLVLNFTFMFVQMLYSFRSKSLGLFSDSLHMLLDCSSLAIGLFAKLISKRIRSIFYDTEKKAGCLDHLEHSHSHSRSHAHTEDHRDITTSLNAQAQAKASALSSTLFSQYPFGLARIETLAAFVNGILLLSIVQDIFFQSIDRILNPISLKNINELLVVSILGLLVNLVGIFAFNHGHDEDDEDDGGHGHSHSLKGLFGGGKKEPHGHDHSHLSSDGGNVACELYSEQTLQPLTNLSGDGRGSSSDNDHGIFLHILADTLGSCGVIVSTVLLKFFPTFKILDPFSSLFIIALILLSSIPLIKNSFVNLLLVLNQRERYGRYADAEALIKDLLNDLYQTPGVLGVTKIKVWKDELGGGGHSHGHSHSHSPAHEEHNAKDKKTGLIGYVHLQYADGENSTIIKKRCEKIVFEQYRLDLFIQLENEVWGKIQ